MKQRLFSKAGYGLMAGMMLALAPLAASYAQDFSTDRPASDELSNQPSTIPESTPTESIEPAPPSSYETREAPMPRGARGPIRSDMRSDMRTSGRHPNIDMDNLRPTERNVTDLPDYQYRLSSVFRSD